MTLDYKNSETGLHNLFGRSIVLNLQKNRFFVLFLIIIFQTKSTIENQNQKKVSFSRMGTHFSP